MITALVIGVGFGLGIWAIFVWAVPPRPGLASLLRQLDNTPAPPPITPQERPGWAATLGKPFVRLLTALGLPSPSLRRDLAITGKPVPSHLADKAALAIAGLLLPTLVSIAVALLGMPLAWEASLIASLLVAFMGFLLPDITVRRDAARRRADFRLALSAYLNLIRVTLAGGAGVEGALTDAATVGRGRSFNQIRRALTIAKVTRVTPWATLRALGDELDVRELAELSSSVSLAGTEGARVRASLQAKASALRTRELTDAEGDAQAATERMSLPVIVLFIGFLLFIGYPAVAAVLGGF
ncbi:MULTISPECIES: type II secretion system F family protein [Amycolatopsis]|uniref:Pilus assembly protein TadC n=1 Tax=Amycolatopsis echigonensis TaxID=2576905 RepID=A0A2N3WNV2_9PSEU|nr:MULTISPECIES: type II secretion system F family protein [Amycolatopsis]PKV95544.1 pilus assembly protein TadC [Amycolatopsis niigatensis]